MMCLVLALAAWPPAVAWAAAAQADGCIAGLPPALAAELQPLIQALGEATGQGLDCTAPSSGQDVHQQQLRLIAEAMALLATADPAYGYSAPGYGYVPPGYSAPPPPPPVAAPANGNATTCGSPSDSPPSGGQSQ